MKALVTGAGGMLGAGAAPGARARRLRSLALRKGDADVTRHDALIHPTKMFQPDWIFHLAAFTKVDDCETCADHAFAINGLGRATRPLAAALVRRLDPRDLD